MGAAFFSRSARVSFRARSTTGACARRATRRSSRARRGSRSRRTAAPRPTCGQLRRAQASRTRRPLLDPFGSNQAHPIPSRSPRSSPTRCPSAGRCVSRCTTFRVVRSLCWRTKSRAREITPQLGTDVPRAVDVSRPESTSRASSSAAAWNRGRWSWPDDAPVTEGFSDERQAHRLVRSSCESAEGESAHVCASPSRPCSRWSTRCRSAPGCSLPCTTWRGESAWSS